MPDIIPNSPAAFAVLSVPGRQAGRTGWLQAGWHVERNPDTGVLERVQHDGANRWPWTPTEDDLFAMDWAWIGAAPPAILPGTWAWALERLVAGAAVHLRAGGRLLPLTVQRLVLAPLSADLLAAADLAPAGRCIAITLPNGALRLWRPQHQDMLATTYTS